MIGQITASNLPNSARHWARRPLRAPFASTHSRWLSTMPRRRSAARLMSFASSLLTASLARSSASGGKVTARNESSIRM
jgi:hypothetical protein